MSAPEPILTYLKRRLRSYIPAQAVDDDSLLRYLSEGYQQLCQNAAALRTVGMITEASGTAEYALPANHFKTISVYRGGVRLAMLPAFSALDGSETGFYGYETTIGYSPTPTAAGSSLVYYVRTPAVLATWNDSLDAEFPPEFGYALVHYVHHRVGRSIGGEGRLGQVGWHKSQFDRAVSKLRDQSAVPYQATTFHVAQDRGVIGC